MAEIRFVKGDLLKADVEALVNTVNTVGVMGKGIALQFKNRFKQNYKIYKDACKAQEFVIGQVLSVMDGDLLEQRYIINFPTKAHWKVPSQYAYIESGLTALREEIVRLGLKSIAIPPLGCGNGGLEWDVVREMIVKALSPLEINIHIYEPNAQIKSLLQQEQSRNSVKLTNARAMLLYLMFHYEAAGEQSSLFVANKLAYFLQRKGEKLRLRFEAHLYGPYAVQLNHVLLHLNGVYLKGIEQNEVKPFEPLLLNYDKYEEVKTYVETKLTPEQKLRLKEVLSLIHRYESSFALELLATVDYVTAEEGLDSEDSILHALSKWSKRKANFFKTEHVAIALDHLANHSSEGLVSMG